MRVETFAPRFPTPADGLPLLEAVARLEGLWGQILERLRRRERIRNGRAPALSVGIIDSQSVKATDRGGPHGYDGCKRVNGIKSHLLVDTMGTVLAVVPRLWVVERTFAWLGKCRCASKDCECLAANSESVIHFAVSMTLLHCLSEVASQRELLTLTGGNTVLVAGVGSGMGLEAARRFGRLGNRIVMVARNTERLQAEAARIEGADAIALKPKSKKNSRAGFFSNLEAFPAHCVCCSAYVCGGTRGTMARTNSMSGPSGSTQASRICS